MRTADLHLHSYYSDGTDSPTRIVEQAKAAGLAAISLTDHDTLEGYPEALAAAQRLGIELIPGLEMSASANGNCDGTPSMTRPMAGPWLSPYVVTLKSSPKVFPAIKTFFRIRKSLIENRKSQH